MIIIFAAHFLAAILFPCIWATKKCEKMADRLSAFCMWQIIEKGPIRDLMGRPLMTLTNASNPWWLVFKQAITSAGGKLAKPEILPSTTDARYIRQKGIPALGFSPMTNTPILLHDHNEVWQFF